MIECQHENCTNVAVWLYPPYNYGECHYHHWLDRCTCYPGNGPCSQHTDEERADNLYELAKYEGKLG